MKDSELIETKIKGENVYDGKLLKVWRDVVRLPNQKEAVREWIKHPRACAVAPLTEDKNLVLVRQYRYPVGKITWEIPAGKLDVEGEDPLDCAKRELSEETGFAAQKYEKILTTATTVGFSNEYIHIYAASGLKRGQMHPDSDEFVDCEEIPLLKALEMVYNGEIIDAKTIIAILWLCQNRNVSNSKYRGILC